MSKILLFFLVVVAFDALASEAFYILEIPESSSHNKEIRSSINDIVSSIKWMEDQLAINELLMKDENQYTSYKTSLSRLLKILQSYKSFFEKILHSDPNDSKQALPEIQSFISMLESSEEIDTMLEEFSDDFSEVSFKLGLILEEFPSITRNVLQSLTSVILLSDQSNLNKTEQVLPAEAETNLLENCQHLQNLTSQIKFVFDGVIIKIIFAVKEISDISYFRVEYNRTLATPKSLQKLVNYEASITRSMIEDRWQSLLNEIKDKFGGVPKNSTNNISKFHNAYLKEVNSTETFLVESVDAFVNKFGNLFGLLMENIDLEILQIRSALLEKSLLSKDSKKLFESYKDEFILKSGLIRDVTKKVIDLVNNNLDVEKDPFGNISNRYIQTFSYQIARITFRTKNGIQLQGNYEKYLKKNGLILRKNILEPSKLFKVALVKKFDDLLTEITTQGYKIVNIGFKISDFVKEIEVK